MKQSNRAVFAALAASLGLTASLPPAYAHERGGGECREGHEKNFMDLSKSQKKQMKAAFKNEKPVMTPLRRALRDAVMKLRDQVEDKAPDSVLQASMDNVAKARTALAAEKKAFRAKLGAILTPSQRAKALLFRMRRMHRMMKGGMAWKGCGCGMRRGPMMRHGGHGFAAGRFGAPESASEATPSSQGE